MSAIHLTEQDALVIVDVQNDFLPRGALAVPEGNEILPVLNDHIAHFQQRGLPVFASRDWHPAAHCSFLPQGGIWPAHCVAGTLGAQFAPSLDLPDSTIVISKATSTDQDAYSAFQETGLADMLRARGIERLFVGGLATDYCVLNTVTDALSHGFKVVLLIDAIKAVDVHPGDGEAAIQAMIRQGALPAALSDMEDRHAGHVRSGQRGQDAARHP